METRKSYRIFREKFYHRKYVLRHCSNNIPQCEIPLDKPAGQENSIVTLFNPGRINSQNLLLNYEHTFFIKSPSGTGNEEGC